MSKTTHNAKNQLKEVINVAIRKAIEKGELNSAELPDYIIESPADRKNGDLSSNIAMVSAKAFRLAPQKIASIIIANADFGSGYIDHAETAGPGFLNFYLKQHYYADILKDIGRETDSYGRTDFGGGKKIMVEFVSANPTGPMHMGNARGGAIGDCLSAVLDAAGYNVWREFYVNDAGNQIEKFAVSLEARYMQLYKGDEVVFPEDGYQGADITDLARLYADEYGDRLVSLEPAERQKELVSFALPKNISKMQSDIAKYKINYDNWFFESELHNNGELSETIEILKSNGMTYEKDGALWYKATENGAEKDEVLVRQNGNPTYFAADIAYHRNKIQKRGYDLCIDVWGADHHGHIARMKGALSALGLDGDSLHVVLIQLVKLVKNGELVRMSKRTGKAIQLSDLLDEVPVDSARFLFNTREANQQMDFDLDLAVMQDSQNPVYYVQYAHARICSIIRKLKSEGITAGMPADNELIRLDSPEECELIACLGAYDSEIAEAARTFNPTSITRYVTGLSALFHKFYNAHRVNSGDEELTRARLFLCICVKTVICNALKMFNIDAPESM